MRAGKAVAVSPNERCVGHESVEGRTAPDSLKDGEG